MVEGELDSQKLFSDLHEYAVAQVHTITHIPTIINVKNQNETIQTANQPTKKSYTPTRKKNNINRETENGQ